MKPGCDQTHDLVPIHRASFLVDHDQAVGIAIERNADIGAFFDHPCLDRIERGRADIAVDIGAVRLDAHGDDIRAQFPDRRWCDLVGGSVGAIDHDLQPVETDVAGHRLLNRVDIATARVVDPAGPADAVGLDEQRLLLEQQFDRCFGLVGKLEAVGTEQLDAIVLVRIVAG